MSADDNVWQQLQLRNTFLKARKIKSMREYYRGCYFKVGLIRKKRAANIYVEHVKMKAPFRGTVCKGAVEITLKKIVAV